MEYVHALYDWVLASALSPVALGVTFAFCMIDGFFPPIPSESIVTALAAVYLTDDPGRLVPLGLLAAAGAFCGDNIAYLIGRRLHHLLERRPDLATKVHDAAAKVEERGALLIVPARFIPVGRVFINMGAGLAEFPHRRFMAITVLSTTVWAAYAIAIGVAAGHWFESNPLLGAAIGVVLGIALGVLLDRIGAARRARAARAS